MPHDFGLLKCYSYWFNTTRMFCGFQIYLYANLYKSTIYHSVLSVNLLESFFDMVKSERCFFFCILKPTGYYNFSNLFLE